MKGNAMNVVIGQPVYVTPVHQWGIVIDIDDQAVRTRLGDGNTIWAHVAELSDEGSLEHTIVLHDVEGVPFTVGCGMIEGQRMFWIDSKHEQVTLVLSDEEEFIEAIREVLQ